MHYSTITGTGRALPTRVITNHHLAQWMETSDEWITSRTGIKERRWIREGETGVGLAKEATEQALLAANVEADALDAIVYANCTPDYGGPGNASLLQHEMGLSTIPTIDIRNQCSGFVYALSVADGWIRSGSFARVLVIGQEVQSTMLDLSTAGRNVSVLFGDGAGAAVLERTDDADHRLLDFDLHTDGRLAKKLWCELPSAIQHPRLSESLIAEGRHYVQMDGKEVFRHAVSSMASSCRRVLEKSNLTSDDIDWVIPHQANQRIIDSLQKALNLDASKVMSNIAKYGNTTAASVPIALDECIRNHGIERGAHVLLTAFGSGFLWGSCLLRWS